MPESQINHRNDLNNTLISYKGNKKNHVII